MAACALGRPGGVATPLFHKATWKYPTAALMKLTVPYLGQSPRRGAYSTLYAATEPSLTGEPGAAGLMGLQWNAVMGRFMSQARPAPVESYSTGSSGSHASLSEVGGGLAGWLGSGAVSHGDCAFVQRLP